MREICISNPDLVSLKYGAIAVWNLARSWSISTYLEPSQISKMVCFSKINNGYKPLSIFWIRPCKSFFQHIDLMWDKFRVNNKDTTTLKVNDKVKNKDTVDVVLAYLFLTLNTFHFLLHCFYCWLWSVNYRLGLLFVVLTLCACWNQFRQSFQPWRN